MTASVAELIIRLRDDASARAAQVAKSLDGIAKAEKAIANQSGAMRKLATDLDKANQAVKRIGDLRDAQKGLSAARTAFQEAQKNVQSLARQVAAAEKPTKELATAMRRAQSTVKQAAAEFDRQKSVTIAAKSAAEKFTGSITTLATAEVRAKSIIESTTAAIKRQAEAEVRAAAQAEAAAKKQEATRLRQQARREGVRNVAGAAGVYLGYRGKQFAVNAVESAAEFDIGVRKQREFVDLPKSVQDKLLIPQAMRIGQETQFSNLDVVRAQTKAMQGLPSDFTAQLRAEVGAGIIENVKNYALVMEADMEASAEAIRSYLQQTGKDISTKEKALQEANLATNKLVKMAKLGGMSDEDVQQFMKFAASPGTTAGLSDDTLMSLGALARRGGLRGDEAGTFIRSASSKLVAPTKKGIAALNAAGINYSSYVGMPDKLETSRLESQFKNDIGVGFTPAVRKRLDSILSDPKLLGDRSAFTAAVTGAVQPLFKSTKKGGMAASDSAKVAKAANSFYGVSAESVDAERLLDAIMNSNMSLAQLNAFFTDKHGGKGAITQKAWDEFKATRQQIGGIGSDPNFAKSKADEIMGGLGGSLERFKGSIENLTQSVGTANEKWLSYSFETVGNLLDSFSNLSNETKVAVTAVAGVGAAFAGVKGLQTLMGGFGLSASAVALNESAAALTLAAARLGAGGAAGVATNAVTTAATTSAVATTTSTAAVPLLTRLTTGLGASSILGPVFAFGAAGEVYKPTTPLSHPYRNDIAIDTGQWERARRAQEEWNRDPEAARGRAWMRMGSSGVDIQNAGLQAGQTAAQGIQQGIQDQAGLVEQEAQRIFENINSMFGKGVDVPIRLQPQGFDQSLRGVHADIGIGGAR
ncbi:phage tail tape measure protein [Microvirga thermotolerans]|uniref:Phage tail tape measure protein n=1 Tax=Microvirga thermotolerans TaxID=2651334 RepID=A0A5P9JU60_9HYPH|nr:phage tail tape measure protein [Microvirga thermotolerans]QFU15318.1 phage tail tape measure protein [Microvirga thermotolerans]